MGKDTPLGRAAPRRRWMRLGAAACLPALVLAVSGCAYYNTFYSARKDFNQAESLYRGTDERATGQQVGLYDRALKSATKLVVKYPRSKWVDDAVLLMGRALLGKGEYEKARQKFTELAVNFPGSELRDQGFYYKAECYRQEHKWEEAQAVLDTLQRDFPGSKLTSRAHLRRGQMLMGQRRYRDAVAVLQPLAGREGGDERFTLLLEQTLADSYYGLAAYDSARVHYAWVAKNALSDETVRQATLRQGDCYEGLKNFDAAVQLYRIYEQDVVRADFRGQTRIRRAYALALAGHVPEGMTLLEQMATEKGAGGTASDALFKIGYIQEVLLDDFPAARETYGKVIQSFPGTAAAQQSDQRLKSLVKIEELRSATAADTTGRQQVAAAAFLVAEHYLFDSGRPERAVAEYARVESLYADTDFGPRAGFAAAWVLAHDLARPASADSAWRQLVDRYPETPFGRAASAYLRGQGDSLRVAGATEPTLVSRPLTPGASPYVPPQIDAKSLRPKEGGAAGAGAGKPGGAPRDTTGFGAAARDTARIVPAMRDTTRASGAPGDTSRVFAVPTDTTRAVPAPRDTTKTPTAPRDTTGALPAPRDTTRVPAR